MKWKTFFLILLLTLPVYADYTTNVEVIEEVVTSIPELIVEPDTVEQTTNSEEFDESVFSDLLDDPDTVESDIVEEPVEEVAEPVETTESVDDALADFVNALEDEVVEQPVEETISADDALADFVDQLEDEEPEEVVEEVVEPVDDVPEEPIVTEVVEEVIEIPLNDTVEELVVNDTAELNEIVELNETVVEEVILEVVDAEGKEVDSIVELVEDRVSIKFLKGPLEEMHLLNAENVTDLPRVDDVPEEEVGSIDGKPLAQVYAIDPTNTTFELGVVEVIAKGTELYKCKDWNFDERVCFGEWILIAEDLVPGNTYFMEITPDDPAFAESSEAVDVTIAPLDNTTFVVAWVDNIELDVSFRIMDTDGSILVNTIDVDTSVDTKSRVSVSPINSTHFVIAWFDGPSKDITRAVYDINGNNVFASADVDTNVKNNVDVSATQLGDRFVVCYANHDDGDADFKIYGNDGSQLVGETNVDGSMKPEATLQNLIGCTGVNSTRWTYFWFDDNSNDATMRIMSETGTNIVGQQDIDTNVGESGQVAITTLDNDKFVMAFYDASADDITVAIRDINNNVILSPTDIDSNAGTQSRVAIAAVKRNDTAASDDFVVVWWDKASSDIKAAVYDNAGTEITAPFTVETQQDTTYRLLDVAGRDPVTGNSICPGNFVVAYTTSSGVGEFNGFNFDGSSWDGNCGDTTNPTINSISDSPDPVDQGENAIITANVTDDVAVDSVVVEIEGTNYTMTQQSGSSTLNIALVCADASCTDANKDVPLKNHLSSTLGHTVSTFIDTNQGWSPTNHDIVVISESVNSGNTGWLKSEAVGILTVEGANWDEFDLGTGGSSSGGSDTDINIVDNSHYITQTFSTGTFTVSTSTSNLGYISGWTNDVTNLAYYTVNSAQSKLLYVENGDTLADSSTAAERRVFYGAQYFANLNNDGKILFNRALDWTAYNIEWGLSHNTSSESGSVSYTVYANDTSNNVASQSGSYTVNLPTDMESPQYSSLTENPSDPSTYLQGANYEFNATWADDIAVDTVTLEFGGSNYTPTQNGNVYTKTFNDLQAGTYNYKWYANDTSGNTNNTGTWTYTVNKASTSTQLFINGAEANKTVTFPSQTNATATTSTGSVTLYRGGSPVSNPEITTLGVAVYNYTAINPGNENYTGSSATYFLTVDQQSSVVDLTLNGVDGNISVVHDTQVNISASKGAGAGVIKLYDEGVLINSGVGPLTNTTSYSTLGVKNITVVYEATENYSASSETHFITVTNNAPTLASISLSPTTVQQETTINVTTSGASDLNGDSYQLMCGSSSGTSDLCTSSSGAGERSCTFSSPWNDDAAHTVYCRITDGYNDSTERTDTVNADNTPPAITLTSVDGDTSAAYWDTSNNSQTILAASTETGASCRYGTSDVVWSSMSNDCSVASGDVNCNLGNVAQTAGTTYYVSCKDSNGNEQNTSENLDVTFGVDYTNPTTYDDYNGSIAVPGLEVTITEDDLPAGTIITTYHCDDTTNTCSPATLIDDGETVSFSTRGTNYLRYYSTDEAGNNQTLKSTQIFINQLISPGTPTFANVNPSSFNVSVTPTDADTQSKTCSAWHRLSGAGGYSEKAMSEVGSVKVTNIGVSDGYNELDVIDVIVQCSDALEDVNSTLTNHTVPDTTPPGVIEDLDIQTERSTWLYWNWTNPSNPDFSENIVFLAGVNVVNTSNKYYNATGLVADTNYTITINTKDDSGNVNITNVSNTAQTETNNLDITETVKDADDNTVTTTMEVIDENGVVRYSNSGSSHEAMVPPGVYDIRIIPDNHVIKEIIFYNFNLTENITDIVDLDDPSDTQGFRELYAINPKLPNFDIANVTVTAKGRSLFKCADWNFTSRICPSGRWKKIMNLVSGQNYTFNMNITDPGFGESNYTIDVLDDDGILLNISENILANNSGILDIEITPWNLSIDKITVYDFNETSASRELRLENSTNATGWNKTYSINPANLSFDNATVTVTAASNTNTLYKCVNWNFTTQTCNETCELDGNETVCSEEWVHVKGIIAGQPYNFTINATDPGFAEASEAVDVAIAPLDNTTFVIAWIDRAELDASFKIMNTNGSVIVNTTDVDTGVDAVSKISAATINSTHFTLAWVDGGADDVEMGIFDRAGNTILSETNVDTNVGNRADVSVIQLGDRYVVCYANDADNDADFKIYDNDGVQIVGETRVDGNMNPGATLQNLIGCTGVNSTRWTYFWFDDNSNDARYRIVNQSGEIETNQQTLDSNVGGSAQVAATTLDTDKFVMAYYDSADDDITIAIRDADNNVILSPTDIDSNAGTSSRMAVAAVRQNATSTNDSFVVAWWDQAAGDIKAAVYDNVGTEVTAPFTIDTQQDTTYRLLDVAARDPITGNSLCPGTFVVAYTNSSNQGLFKGYYVNGTSWGGSCTELGSINVSILYPMNGLTYNTKSLFIRENTTGDMPDTCWYNLNGGSNTTYTCSSEPSITAVEGLNNLTVYANTTGNVIASADSNFTVNTSIPLTISMTSPANDTLSTSATPKLKLLATGSYNNSNYTVYIYYANDTLYAVGNNGSLNDNTETEIILEPALTLIGNSTTYKFIANATDAGNNTATSNTVFYTLTKPAVELVSPVNNYWDTDGDISFSFKVYDENFLTSDCSLYINAVLNQTNSSSQTGGNITTFDVTSISDAANQTWKIQCSDPFNNTGSDSRTFHGDAAAPVINSISDSPDPVNETQIINITANVTDNIGIDSVIVNISGPRFAMTYYSGNIYYYEHDTSDQNGLYNYTVEAYDYAGTQTTSSSNFTVSGNDAPVAGNVSLTSTSGNNYTTDNLTVTFDAYDADNDAVKNITNWYGNDSSITVLNMPFEGSSATDYSGYGNDGVVNGATWNATSGFDGFGAYLFDGVDDFINISDSSSLNITENLTILAWIKINTTYPFAQAILEKGSLDDDNYAFMVNINQLYFEFNGSSGAESFRAESGNLSIGEWYHVGVVVDSSSVKFYVDGTNIQTNSTSGTLQPKTYPLLIGMQNYPGNEIPFNGTIDELMIFNRVLSDEQIQAIYNGEDKIVSQETEFGDVWKACITTNDGTEDGTEVCSNNLTISGDNSEPVYSTLTETPSDPATYAPNAEYEFNATWTDNVEIDEVVIEFDGTNYTPTQSGSVFSRNFSDLAVGTYNYKWYANDTSGNANNTGTLTYTIDKASGTVDLTLDGTDGNITVNAGSSVNITATLTSGEADIDVYEDGSSISSGASPQSLLKVYNTLGAYNITAVYNATQNYTSGIETHFVIVEDSTAPAITTLTESPSDPNPYSPSQSYNFTANVTDLVGVDNVTIEFEGVNYSVSVNSDTYYKEFVDLAVGTYNYRWFANDSSGNLNITANQTYTVDNIASEVNLTLDGTDGNITVEVGSTVNATGTLITGESYIELYGDASLINNGTSPISSFPTYNVPATVNITLVYPASENYSTSSETHFVIVQDTNAPALENLTETPADPATYVPGANYNFTVDASDFVSVDTVTLEFEGTNYTASGSGTYYKELTDLAAGTYNYKWFANDTSDNTNITANLTYTIDKAASLVNLTLDGTDNNITAELGSTVNVTGTLITGEDNLDIYEVGSSIASGSSPQSLLKAYNSLGTYNITLTYNATENYTSSSETHFITTEDTTAPTVENLTESPADPATYSSGQTYNFTADVSDLGTVGTVTIEFEGVNYTASGSGTYYKEFSDLTAGTYNYKWFANDTTGNLQNTSNLTYTVNKAASLVNLTLNGTDDDIAIEVGSNVNLTGTLITGESYIELYESGVLINNGYSSLSNVSTYNSVGTYNITVVYLESENYTSSSETHFVSVSDTGAPSISSLTESPADPAIYTSQTYNFTADVTDIDGVDTVLIEFDGVNYTTTPASNTYYNEFNDLAAGTYSYLWYANDSSNNLAASAVQTYTVNKTSSSADLTLDGTDGNITVGVGSTVNLTGTLITGESYVELYEESILINNGSSPLNNLSTYFTLGLRNITIVYPTSENYSTSSETHFVNVVDTGSPLLENATETPVDPTTYSVGQDYNFTIDVADATIIDAVTLEFDGVNYTAFGNGTYYRELSNLAAGTYNYKWFANDTSGNTNETGTLSYTINKDSSSVNLTLDGADGNIAVELGSSVNISGTLVSGESSIDLYEGGSSINSGASPLNNQRTYNSVGTINITVTYNATENYTTSSETHLITVSDSTPSVIENLTESPVDPTTYTSQTYNFTADVSDLAGVDTVTLEFGGFNYTTSVNGNTYSKSFNDLIAGTYNYKWHANDSNGNLQNTSTLTYTVNRAPSSVDLTLNGADNNISVEAGASVTITGTLTAGESDIELYEAGSLINSGSSPLTNVASYTTLGVRNITITYPQSQNYSSSSETHFVTVGDTTAPSVSNVLPQGSSYVPDENVTIQATVTDIVGVDSVLANVTLPNSTVLQLSMNSSGNLYSAEFNSTSATGQYNVIIIANDTSNLVSTETGNFTVATPSSPSSSGSKKGGSAQRTLRGGSSESEQPETQQGAGQTPQEGTTYQVSVTNTEPETTLTNLGASLDGPDGISIILAFDGALEYEEEGIFTLIIGSLPDGTYRYDLTIDGKFLSGIALGEEETFVEKRILTVKVSDGKVTVTEEVLETEVVEVSPEEKEAVEGVARKVKVNKITGASTADVRGVNKAAVIWTIVLVLAVVLCSLYLRKYRASHAVVVRDHLVKSAGHVKSAAKVVHGDFKDLHQGFGELFKSKSDVKTVEKTKTPVKESKADIRKDLAMLRSDFSKLGEDFDQVGKDFKLMIKEFKRLARKNIKRIKRRWR